MTTNILVTGTSRGIGAAILDRLAREARVLLQPGEALPKLSGQPDDAYHMEQV